MKKNSTRGKTKARVKQDYDPDSETDPQKILAMEAEAGDDDGTESSELKTINEEVQGYVKETERKNKEEARKQILEDDMEEKWFDETDDEVNIGPTEIKDNNDTQDEIEKQAYFDQIDKNFPLEHPNVTDDEIWEYEIQM